MTVEYLDEIAVYIYIFNIATKSRPGAEEAYPVSQNNVSRLDMRKITCWHCSHSVFRGECSGGCVAPVERARFVVHGGNASNACTSPLFHGVTFLKGLRRERGIFAALSSSHRRGI